MIQIGCAISSIFQWSTKSQIEKKNDLMSVFFFSFFETDIGKRKRVVISFFWFCFEKQMNK